MLDHVRVLDLTDERGQLCGQILAGLGADVIAIEPPGGSRSRTIAPFAGGAEGAGDGERSLSTGPSIGASVRSCSISNPTTIGLSSSTLSPVLT